MTLMTGLIRLLLRLADPATSGPVLREVRAPIIVAHAGGHDDIALRAGAAMLGRAAQLRARRPA